jgi:hypothetical protein
MKRLGPDPMVDVLTAKADLMGALAALGDLI